MPSRLLNILRSMATTVLVAAVVLTCSASALADKLHLKDGRVLEGTVVREGKEFVFFRIRVGSISQEQMFSRDQILKIEQDDQTPKDDESLKAKEEADRKAETDKKAAGRHTGATRVAILNFGPPNEWLGSAGDMVGVQISASAFAAAVPMLKKEKVDVVVIRINSGGGYSLERDRFEEIFEKQYKPNFRTVAWVQSAISAAAMSPWVLEEFYFFPDGSIGGCTEWSGGMVASKGARLEMILAKMERASELGKHDRKIMRSMQIMEALSVDYDSSGNVVWRQDELGQFVLNRHSNVYTMNASDAVRFGFGEGIAANKEELVKALKLQEVEWVAENVTKFLDDNIRENDKVERRNRETFDRYTNARGLAAQLQDKQRRGQQISIARRALEEIKRFVKLNPNFQFHLGIELSPEWFEAQDEELKRLAALP